MDMLTLATVVLSVATVGGLTLGTMHFMGRPIPPAFAMGHGGLAVTGVGLLVLAVIRGAQDTLLLVSLGIYVLVVLGGMFMGVIAKRAGGRPTLVVAGHGMGALVALGLLLSVSL